MKQGISGAIVDDKCQESNVEFSTEDLQVFCFTENANTESDVEKKNN